MQWRRKNVSLGGGGGGVCSLDKKVWLHTREVR